MPPNSRKCCCGVTPPPTDGGECCYGCGRAYATQYGLIASAAMCTATGGQYITPAQLATFTAANPTKLPCCELTAPWIPSPPLCKHCQDKSFAEMAAAGCGLHGIYNPYGGSGRVSRWKKSETNQSSFYVVQKIKEYSRIYGIVYGTEHYFCGDEDEPCPECYHYEKTINYEATSLGTYAGIAYIPFLGCTSHYVGAQYASWTLGTAQAFINSQVETNQHSIYSGIYGYRIDINTRKYSVAGTGSTNASCGNFTVQPYTYKYKAHDKRVNVCAGNWGFYPPYDETINQQKTASDTIVLVGSDNALKPNTQVPKYSQCWNDCCDCGFGLGEFGVKCTEPWGCCVYSSGLGGGESCSITRRNTCNVGRGWYGEYTRWAALGTGNKEDYTCNGCTSVYVGLCVYTGKTQTPNTPIKTCTASLTRAAASAIVDQQPPDPDVYQYIITPENSCGDCPLDPDTVAMEKWCIKDTAGNVLECSSVATTVEVFEDRWIYWAELLRQNAIAANINPQCIFTEVSFGNQADNCASCVNTNNQVPVKKCCIQDLAGTNYYCANATYCECRAQQTIADAQIKALNQWDAATIKWETPLNCATECIKYTGACCLVLSDGSLYECSDDKDQAQCQARAEVVNVLLDLPYPDGDYVTWQWQKGVTCADNLCI